MNVPESAQSPAAGFRQRAASAKPASAIPDATGNRNLAATTILILAAGEGTRMRSALPKVLHALAGKPMVQHVIETARALDATAVHTVIGHGAERVQSQLAQLPTRWVL